MTAFEPSPSGDAVEAVRSRWREGTDTFDRVYDAVLGVTEPTRYADIAEIAACSPNAAKKHLDRLAAIGVVRAHRDARPARYERDDGYLEWQEARRIAWELSVDEILDRVAELEARRAAFEDRFETEDPTSVSVLEVDDHEAVHERMVAVSEWRMIDHQVRLYELARQMALNDGRLLPA